MSSNDDIELSIDRSTMSAAVLEEILGLCAPIGNKGMKFPDTFRITVTSGRLRFKTMENVKLLTMRADEDGGFEATRAYILALRKICELKSSILAAQILLAQSVQ